MTGLEFIKLMLVDCWLFTTLPFVCLVIYGLYEAVENKWERRYNK